MVPVAEEQNDEQLEGLIAAIEGWLPAFLPRQRWYGGDLPPLAVEVVAWEKRRDDPLLLWVLIDVTHRLPGELDRPSSRYQLVLGARPVDTEEKFMLGKERVTLGASNGLVVYDALVDPELALDVLAMVAPDEEVAMARPLLVEQSNTSVVYDERLILKLFRLVHPGVRNPDVEVNRELADRGFRHVVTQRAELRRDDTDLAVVRDYILGAADAWQLAHTSLRDLLAERSRPDEAGGDFGPQAAALGEVTAEMHVVLAEAFGTHAADPASWLEDMLAQVDRVALNGIGTEPVMAALRERFEVVTREGAGSAIHIHGDLHLGQFILGDDGWYVLDFEGEPDRPLAERQRPWSPLRDVAGVLRSFHYASRAVLVERGRDIDPELVDLSEAWECRAATAFWRGYRSVDQVAELLPSERSARRALLSAFELDKAVYEIGYERAHRPSWVDIPVAAVERLLRRPV
jgi:maltokinase